MPVEFEDQQFERPGVPEQKRGGLVGLVIKLGIAKNAGQANLILIGIAIVAILLTVFIMWPDGQQATATLPEDL